MSCEINIPFEFKLVHGSEALETCAKLSEEKGITPVIVGSPGDADPFFDLEFEEWEGVPAGQKEEIIAHVNILSREPLEEVYIGLIPTEKSFKAPAYVSFGNWNDCPSPEEHISIMQYWNEKYGIEIVSMTADVIGCRVSNPPATKEAALLNAKYGFSGKINLS